jgi:hypothetical protein
MAHAEGRINNSKDNGVFGGNDATVSAPAGKPVGNGVFGFSNVPNASGVFGANNNGGIGVAGNSDKGDGMDARTSSSAHSGIFARNDATAPAPAGTPGGNGVFGLSTVPNASGVFGANNNGGTGVAGIGHGNGDGVSGLADNGAGVIGRSAKNGVVGQTKSDVDAGVNGRNDGKGFGVFGGSQAGSGVEGHSVSGNGGVGFSEHNDAVVGKAFTAGKTGVLGLAPDGNAVGGISERGNGVRGVNGAGSSFGPDRGCGILGESINGFGVFGSSDNHFGIKAVSRNGVGLSAEGPKLAAFFRGDVEVTGDIRLSNADFAEDFNIRNAETVEPGTVMVLDAEGGLQSSQQAYDKRVAGVISGAGDFKPAIILDRQESQDDRMPLALVGKTYCKVDAQYASIEIGDLLTTSPTPGHAMKASDPLKAFGAVIGKALRPLQLGQGMIPMLIALQ